MTSLKALSARLAHFVEARDWAQFHTPKNLAVCLSVEASELLELFMWTRDGVGPHPPGAGPPDPARVEEEIGDIVLSLLNFCSSVGIDPVAAAHTKLARLDAKYPVDLARGSAVKSDLLLAENAARTSASPAQPPPGKAPP